MAMLHDAWEETWAQGDQELARQVMRALSMFGQAAPGSAFRRLAHGLSSATSPALPPGRRPRGARGAARRPSGATRCLLQRWGSSWRRCERQRSQGVIFGGSGFERPRTEPPTKERDSSSKKHVCRYVKAL